MLRNGTHSPRRVFYKIVPSIVKLEVLVIFGYHSYQANKNGDICLVEV